MNALDRALKAIDAESSNELHRATARGLMRGYDLRWRDQEERAISIESEFHTHIYNLHAKKKISHSRTFDLAGKIDVDVLWRRDHRYVLDHKTTSDEISEPDGTFWSQLVIEGQVDAYLLARQFQGIKVAGAIWDVIKKPGIKPKLISKADKTTITSLGTYFGDNVTSDTQKEIVSSGKESKYRENGELYEIRLYHECKDNLSKYFQRRPILRLQNELVEYAGELWDMAYDVLACRQRTANTGRPPVRNCGSCMTYGTPCEYLGICSGYDNLESNKWQRRKSIHSELTTIDGDGRNILTSSRLKCFQACKRKHYYRYELGIERVDRQLSDALTFGTIMHKGLEAWWQSFLITPITQGDTSERTNHCF